MLRYFSPITTIGTPPSAAAQEPHIACMFPADDATGAYHRQWLDAHAHAPVRRPRAQDALMKSMNARSAGGTRRRPG
ncbi:conserved hypothetical protein [Burkholderia cenocepacia]|nr:conserved hypothetical protein [Burkholderia cenocepacia]